MDVPISLAPREWRVLGRSVPGTSHLGKFLICVKTILFHTILDSCHGHHWSPSTQPADKPVTMLSQLPGPLGQNSFVGQSWLLWGFWVDLGLDGLLMGLRQGLAPSRCSASVRWLSTVSDSELYRWWARPSPGRSKTGFGMSAHMPLCGRRTVKHQELGSSRPASYSWASHFTSWSLLKTSVNGDNCAL